MKDDILRRVRALQILRNGLTVNEMQISTYVEPEIMVLQGLENIAALYGVNRLEHSEEVKGDVLIVEDYFIIDDIKVVRRDYRKVTADV